MRITADTNVLVRAIANDDPRQSPLAQDQLTRADVVAIPEPVLCELVWVLSRGYKFPLADIAEVIRHLINDAKVLVERPAVEAGLAVLDAGGDFADGIIAYQGSWFGGETFVSFDQQAVALLKAQGSAARLLH